MMKYKVGDWVKVRDDLLTGNSYTSENGKCSLVCSVEASALRGSAFQVSTMDSFYYYVYEGSGGLIPFTDSMLEPFSPPVEDEKEPPSSMLFGVDLDAPVVENEYGGKQSDAPYGFHLLPLGAMFNIAKVAKYGADKYGETFDSRNYTKIPAEEHVNHAIMHLYAYLSGDKQDDHLGHAALRALFACDVAKRKDG